MSYYAPPVDMYTARADHFKRDGDRHWAMAKGGCGDYHYGKAKFCYAQVAANKAKAEHAIATGATFRRIGSTKH